MQDQRAVEHQARRKFAELPSTTGALVLSVGLGAALSSYIGSIAVFLLVVGIVSHGWGMLQKHRLEARESHAPAWWETALYWVCWVALALLALLIGIKAVTG